MKYRRKKEEKELPVLDQQPKVAGPLRRRWQSSTGHSCLLCVYQFVADSTTICKSLEIPAVYYKDVSSGKHLELHDPIDPSNQLLLRASLKPSKQ